MNDDRGNRAILEQQVRVLSEASLAITILFVFLSFCPSALLSFCIFVFLSICLFDDRGNKAILGQQVRVLSEASLAITLAHRAHNWNP